MYVTLTLQVVKEVICILLCKYTAIGVDVVDLDPVTKAF